ncbi:hypothetical protein DOS84_14415 [Flavobacterium aquariorum]|uniref:Uncharacterized protein n=1 Tax=Flavobacterium aquariorum TaxID=2217670 RepID=A0A2W7UBS2_9FLAO|nr:hypothetical protein [Flavobacterium aquariorum]PZX92647.1 hypothetical protein DOS84_14415 [Flavobacterium aquariorum]
MKNIIPEIDTNQAREFTDQKDNKFGYTQNQYSIVEQKQKKKTSSKLIKGKVKVYSNNDRLKLTNSQYHDDESELELISERMLLFLKFTFLILIVTVFFLFLKKSI